MAVSFQESAGATAVWAAVQAAVASAKMDAPSRRASLTDSFEFGGAGQGGLYGSVSGGGGGEAWSGRPPSELPAPELSQLHALLHTLTTASPFAHAQLAALALRPRYLRRLLDTYRMCEDLDDLPGCASCAAVVKALVLLNDTSLLEALISAEHFADVCGCLEHDASAPQQRPHHRAALAGAVQPRELVPIAAQSTRDKIQDTFRITFLKDVVLPHALDDATHSTLSSLALFNHVDVLLALQAQPGFLAELFAKLAAAQPGSTAFADLLAMLQEMTLLARHLQPPSRNQLFLALTTHGAFQVLTAALRAPHSAVWGAAVEVLSCFLCHDPGALRAFLMGQDGHPLFRVLVERFLGASQGPHEHHGDGVQGAVLEVLRILVDPDSMEQAVEKNDFLELFYTAAMPSLLDTISAAGGASGCDVSVATLVSVLELLCFCVKHHNYRIKYYILRNNLGAKVLGLTVSRREALLHVAGVRVLRACCELRDEFYVRYIVKQALFDSVVGLLERNRGRNNLLQSTLLELLEWVRREGGRNLVAHVWEQYGARLTAAAGPTGPDAAVVAALRRRCEQGEEAEQAAMAGVPGPGRLLGGGGAYGGGATQPGLSLHQRCTPAARMPGARLHGSMDSREESYFFSDGGEGEDAAWPAAGPGPPHPAPQAAPPADGTAHRSLSPPPPQRVSAIPPRSPPSPLARLVDYGDEADTDRESLPQAGPPKRPRTASPPQEGLLSLGGASLLHRPPPQRRPSLVVKPIAHLQPPKLQPDEPQAHAEAAQAPLDGPEKL